MKGRRERMKKQKSEKIEKVERMEVKQERTKSREFERLMEIIILRIKNLRKSFCIGLLSSGHVCKICFLFKIEPYYVPLKVFSHCQLYFLPARLHRGTAKQDRPVSSLIRVITVPVKPGRVGDCGRQWKKMEMEM